MTIVENLTDIQIQLCKKILDFFSAYMMWM